MDTGLHNPKWPFKTWFTKWNALYTHIRKGLVTARKQMTPYQNHELKFVAQGFLV